MPPQCQPPKPKEDLNIRDFHQPGRRNIGVAAPGEGEVEWHDNNAGTFFVKPRKTDRGDLSKRPPISEETVSALRAIMPVAALVNAEDQIFGLSESQIGRRVRQAALAAGVGDGFSGNSGRVGKVWDLLDEGSGIPELMEAGRWKSAVMPARYIKKKDESSGFVRLRR